MITMFSLSVSVSIRLILPPSGCSSPLLRVLVRLGLLPSRYTLWLIREKSKRNNSEEDRRRTSRIIRIERDDKINIFRDD